MKTVRKFKAFASLRKIVRQPQASNTPLCHKTIKHSNECVFRAMQTDEFGVSDFIGSSVNKQVAFHCCFDQLELSYTV